MMEDARKHEEEIKIEIPWEFKETIKETKRTSERSTGKPYRETWLPKTFRQLKERRAKML